MRMWQIITQHIKRGQVSDHELCLPRCPYAEFGGEAEQEKCIQPNSCGISVFAYSSLLFRRLWCLWSLCGLWCSEAFKNLLTFQKVKALEQNSSGTTLSPTSMWKRMRKHSDLCTLFKSLKDGWNPAPQVPLLRLMMRIH